MLGHQGNAWCSRRQRKNKKSVDLVQLSFYHKVMKYNSDSLSQKLYSTFKRTTFRMTPWWQAAKPTEFIWLSMTLFFIVPVNVISIYAQSTGNTVCNKGCKQRMKRYKHSLELN